MNNKGFTLTELLAVILILAVVLTIGTFAFNSIRNNTLDKQYESLVEDIKTSAKRYAYDKDMDIVYVQTLVDYGAISSENGFVNNPKDGNKLNCYYVDLNNDSFIESNDCSKKTYDGQVEIKDCTNGTCTNLKDYYGSNYSNIDLSGNLLNSTGDSSYSWTSTSNPGEIINNKEYQIKILPNVCQERSISLSASEGSSGLHQREQQIKIDTINPIIQEITKSIKDNGLLLTTKGTDDCSGLKKYIIKKDNIVVQETNISGTNKTIEYLAEVAGKYEIIIYDQADNSISKTIVLNTDDFDYAPTDALITGGTEANTNEQKVTLTCSDDKGITGYYFGTDINNIMWISVNPIKNFSTVQIITSPGKYYLACKDELDRKVTSSPIEIVEYNIEYLVQKDGKYESNNIDKRLIKKDTQITINSTYSSNRKALDGCNTTYNGISDTKTLSNNQELKSNVISGKTYYVWLNRVNYNLTINGDDHVKTIIGQGQYECGKKVNVSAVAKEMYKINGFTTVTGNKVLDNSVTLTQNTELKVTSSYVQAYYNITYNLDGGTNYSSAPTTFERLEGTNINGKPTKNGYVFNGWNLDGTTTTSFNLVIPSRTTRNIIVNAKWCKTCSNVSNGSCSLNANTPGTCTYTTTCNSNYHYVSGSGTSSPVCTADTYAINYTLNNGTNNINNPTKYAYGTGAIISGKPTRSGYTFNGWKNVTSSSTYAFSQTIGSNSTGEVTLAATWCKNCPSVSNGSCTLNASNAGICSYTTSCLDGYDMSNKNTVNVSCEPHSYNITYNLDGGSFTTITPASKYTYTRGLTIDVVPSKTSNKFNGWTMDGSTPTFALTISSTTKGNKTVSALWCHECNNIANGSCKLDSNTAGACKYTTSCNTGYYITNNGKYNASCSQITCNTGYKLVGNECQRDKFNLDLIPNEGISKIYFKVNGNNSYSNTPTTVSTPVEYDSTYYVYAVAMPGYYYNAYTVTSPLSSKMPASKATYSPTATKCAIGTYSNTEGATSCTTCPAGTTTTTSGAKSCTTCSNAANVSAWNSGCSIKACISGYSIKNNTCVKDPVYHTISYLLNSGTNYTGAPTKYQEGVGTTINGTPTKSGAKFMGWSRPGYSTKFYSFEIDKYDTSDYTFTANWCSCSSPLHGSCSTSVPSAGTCNVTYSCDSTYNLSGSKCVDAYPITLETSVTTSGWTKSKKIRITYKNVSSYAVVSSSTSCSSISSSNWIATTESSTTQYYKDHEITEELSSTGKNYKVCAKNSHGRTAETIVNVNKIDKTPPYIKSVSSSLESALATESITSTYWENAGTNCNASLKTKSKTAYCSNSKCTVTWVIPRCTGSLYFLDTGTVTNYLTYYDALSGVSRKYYVSMEEYLNGSTTPYTGSTPCLVVKGAKECTFRLKYAASDNAGNNDEASSPFVIDYVVKYG